MPKDITVIFHNESNYDCHFTIRQQADVFDFNAYEKTLRKIEHSQYQQKAQK